jgi:hypothetical protein
MFLRIENTRDKYRAFSTKGYIHNTHGVAKGISHVKFSGLVVAWMFEAASGRGLQNLEMNDALYNLVFAEKYPSDIGRTTNSRVSRL